MRKCYLLCSSIRWCTSGKFSSVHWIVFSFKPSFNPVFAYYVPVYFFALLCLHNCLSFKIPNICILESFLPRFSRYYCTPAKSSWSRNSILEVGTLTVTAVTICCFSPFLATKAARRMLEHILEMIGVKLRQHLCAVSTLGHSVHLFVLDHLDPTLEWWEVLWELI